MTEVHTSNLLEGLAHAVCLPTLTVSQGMWIS